ncbi:MAG: hypothetical protein V1913_09810 [Fibrobacterota bacterium]
MFRFLALTVMTAVLFIGAGCSKDKKDNPTAPAVTGTVYRDTIQDPVLAGMLPGYTGSKYKYILNSENTFNVLLDIGYGFADMSGVEVPSEEGTYSFTAGIYTFTPNINRYNNSSTHLMETADTLRIPYTGSGAGDSITIANFINIGNKTSVRNLGTIVLNKQ